MLLPTVFLALLLAAPLPAPGAGNAIAIVPDEPGAIVLPDAAILQTVAADIDGDRRRELVRLVRGDGEAVLAEVWGLDEAGWQLRGEPVEVVQPSRIGTRIDPVYQSTPVRLLVRRVDGAERVTVASQPHFEEIDVGPACCLVLDDLAIEDGSALRRSVAAPGDFASAILVIDFDGDGTDELLTTRSLPPVGDISYPIDARVYRWADDAFGAPTVTPLPVGSGDSPFLLGDSDGIPGDEAAIISTLGPAGIYRIRLIEDDTLAMDGAGFTADGAVAVPLEQGRGVAVTGPVVGLMVAEWPPGGPVSEPRAESFLTDGRIVGTVVVRDQPRLVVHQPSTDAIHMLGLPGLLPPQGVTITRSPAAAGLSDVPLAPFSGPIPGGIGGVPTILHDGRLIPAMNDDGGPTGTSLVAALAGSEPVGLVGDGDLIALHHATIGRAAPTAEGGALVVPDPLEGAWTSVVRFASTVQAETDDGDLDPPLRSSIRLDARDGIAIGRGGFIAEVTAPPGSRVIVAGFDPSVIRTPIVVPAAGQVDAPFVPPVVATGDARYRAMLLVLTPAGHAYVGSWDVRVMTRPPPLDVIVSTPFGSSAVEISGLTVRSATVRIDGRPIEVSAGGRFATTVELPPLPTDVSVEVDDGLGNTARQTVSGIGLFDYRGLPWVPITVALVALAGLILFLRVPRSTPFPRRADDDAGFEELEPD